MIIGTEIYENRDYGYPIKEIVVSYVDKSGNRAFLRFPIPREWMYQWRYLKPGLVKDADYQSWDFKDVYREPINDGFTEQRIHEMLLDMIKMYPQMSEIFDLNMPDTAFCDIEVDVIDEFPEVEDHKYPVNTISWVHNDVALVLGRKPLTNEQIDWIQRKVDDHCSIFKTKYKFQYMYFEKEYDMLCYFYTRLMPSVSCVTGWNFFGYDWPYMYNRITDTYGVDLNNLSGTIAPTKNWYDYSPQKSKAGTKIKLPKHYMLYDYMEIYGKWDTAVSVKENNTLDWVAETVTGKKKVEHDLGFKEMWAQKPAEYIFYNAIDSVLVREIDQKIKTSSAFFGLANLMHVDALTAFSPVRSLEIVQAEYLYKENKVFPFVPKKKKEDGVEESYEGAYVYDPIPGIYRNVIALDFASLYPTTMRQFNISPETFVEKNKLRKTSIQETRCTSGAIYRNDFEGFIPKILTDFYTQRKKYKHEMMDAIDEKYKLMEIYKSRFNKEY